MTDASRHKDTIRAAYDAQAGSYGERATLQGGNLTRLLARLVAAAGHQPPGDWLDVGAGAGLLPERLAHGGVIPPSTRYTGVDLSPGMVAQASLGAPAGARFLVADAEALPFPAGAFDVVLSNSVLHWLHDPAADHRPDRALAEMARVLRPGGWVAVSVAATGTARRFQAAYHDALAELRAEGVAVGPARTDPIGCLALHELVDQLQGAGFTVASADLVYEPVRYPHPDGYAADVAAYGWGIYLAPVPEASRDDAWRRIRERFAARQGGGPYLHDQYMAYAVARR